MTRRSLPSCWMSLGLAAVVAVTAAPALGQTTKKGATTKGQPATEQPAEARLERKDLGPIVFRDPRTRPLLNPDGYDQLFRSVQATTAAVDGQIRGMAEKNQPAAQAIQQYVQYQARVLTDHRNLQAMMDVNEGDPKNFRQLEEAAERLIMPLEIANARKGVLFRREMVKAMVDPAVGGALLKNHLHARTQYLVALAASADPLALDTFLGVLADKNQPSVAKLIANRGIAKIVGNGARVEALDGATRIRAARGVSDYLKAEADTMWPAVEQGLETLGTLRQESYDPAKGDLEFLVTAVSFLVNPQQPIEVRSRAAWSIGMMRINANTRVNYSALAAHFGDIAVEIAEQITAEYDPTIPTEASYQNDPVKEPISQLITKATYALKGDPSVPESGLAGLAARGGRGEDRQVVDTVTNLSTELSKSAVGLIQAAGSLRTPAKTAFGKATSELRSYLTKNMPKDLVLFPGGPELPAPVPGGSGEEAPAPKVTP